MTVEVRITTVIFWVRGWVRVRLWLEFRPNCLRLELQLLGLYDGYGLELR